MKFITTLIILASNCFAQNKKELFFDEDSISITKTEFIRNTDHTTNIGSKIDDGNTIINKLYLREKIAVLSHEKYSNLKNYIQLAAADNKIIVINYYSGLDTITPNKGKSTWNIYYPGYLKKLKKMGNVAQFWFYKYDKNLKYHHADQINWLYDKSAFIEKTFFPYHFNSGSFAVILPNGKYYTYFGEYGSEEVYMAIEKMKKQYAN